MDENHEFFVTQSAIYFQLLYVLLGFCSVLVTFFSPVPWFFAVVLGFFIFLATFLSCTEPGLGVKSIYFSSISGWVLVTDGLSINVALLPSSIVARCFSVLYFQDQHRRKYSIVMLSGVFEAYSHRRLRFLLRTHFFN